MVWCLRVTILSLVISQGADGEPNSLGPGGPCGDTPRSGEGRGRAGSGEVGELRLFTKSQEALGGVRSVLPRP